MQPGAFVLADRHNEDLGANPSRAFENAGKSHQGKLLTLILYNHLQ